MTKEVQVNDEEENLGPYRGKYKAEVYKDEAVSEEEATLDGATEDTLLVDDETISGNHLQSKTEVQTEEHDYKKRYDDLKKHYDSKLHEWREEKEELVSQPQGEEAPEYDADIENFKENYPDVYNVVEAMTAKNSEKELAELRKQVSLLSSKEEQLKAKGAYQELLALHPNFSEIKKSEKFASWLEEQPPSISDGITKNKEDVRWASRVLDLYEADIGSTKKVGRSRKQQSAAAEAVTRTKGINVATDSNANKKVWTTSEIRKLKPHEYSKFEAELDLANAEGRIQNR
tara:strand:- start:1321 stop:2184 length:864 start_codon:yes stop_codon:yes gene_type:complete